MEMEMEKKELQLEKNLIKKLEDMKYTCRTDIRNRQDLEKNFREKFQARNWVNLTDAEFVRLRDELVTSNVYTAAKTLREQQCFEREDGTPLYYTLVNTKDWSKNEYEVINQLRINPESGHHRHDVILLINAIPVVQIELKNQPIVARKAMEQVVEYKNDSGNGYTNTLLCFMQMFIVSNEHQTYYFANNSAHHFSFNADERFLPIYELADENNKKLVGLNQFTQAFLSKSTLWEIISRYMVLVASEQKLMMMRPYQIGAVKAIVDCIHQNRGNGYIWHPTGSGNTLTSFKAATLLNDNPDVDKCLFVVDRKGLDRQAQVEFNTFQDGCVKENTSTEALVRRLLSDDKEDKVIVTTIQKLSRILDDNSKRNQSSREKGKQTYKERLEQLLDQRVVIIFDGCHGSQLVENHKSIKAFFPKAQLFGFTGTPIVDDNSINAQLDGKLGFYVTTENVFEKQLHDYTITNAIEDRNVLGFHIDYFGKGSGDENKKPKKAQKPTPEAVIKSILEKHNKATDSRRFNAILATASINNAIEYYEKFKTIQAALKAEDDDFEPLNISCVFSSPAQALSQGKGADGNKNDKEVNQLQDDLAQEKADNKVDPEKKKAALIAIIDDYNRQYRTNHSINNFDRYYQDVQQRIKDQKYSNADYPRSNKIDIVIVVDMLLTGFDSKYLNTLYVDKNLKHHGLIQAFSRTNRVLNGTKPWGNIIDFRGQEKEVNEAIELFSGSAKGRAKEIWLAEPAPVMVEKYKMAVDKLQTFMSSKGLECAPSEVPNLKGDAAKAEFIENFKAVQKMKIQLDQYTDLNKESKWELEHLLPADTLRGFKGSYLETAQHLMQKQNDGSSEDDEKIQQLDFEFVLFSSAVIDYNSIMGLIAKSTQSTSKQTMTRAELIDTVSANANLMENRDDIVQYINSLQAGEVLSETAIREGYESFKKTKSMEDVTAIANKHGLAPGALKVFVNNVMKRMIFDGEQLSDLLAPLNLGWQDRTKKELALMVDLVPHFERLANGRDISGLDYYCLEEGHEPGCW